MSKQFLLVLTQASEETIIKVFFCVQPLIEYMLNILTALMTRFFKDLQM